jgi:hypothetical protein
MIVPARRVHAAHSRVSYDVWVNIRKSDERILAAQLERDVLDGALGGGPLDSPPGRRRADEGDAFDIGMADDRVTHAAAVAGDDVEDPGRQRLPRDFRKN